MGTIRWSDQELKSAGIDKLKLKILLRRFAECEKIMRELDLSIYGESGNGYLIHRSRPEHDDSGRADTGAIVADAGQGFDGGAW